MSKLLRTSSGAALRRTVSLLAMAAAVMAASSARAQSALSPDLQEIAAAGEIVIGVREDALPFAFVDQDGKPKGYSVDICTRIAENLRQVLNKPDLRIRFNTLTVTTREMLVREKVVDLECGNTSNTKARGANFDFSVAYGVEQAQLISLAKEPVGAADLARNGARVMVTSGSSSAQWLAGGALGKPELVPVRNAGRAYFELSDRKEHAYIGSGEVFMGEVLRRGGQATDFKRVQLDAAAAEPLAAMMRKGRPGLKKVADDTINQMAANGDLNKLYARWFTSPIATRRMSLDQPMSVAWAQAVKSPSDLPAN